MSQGLLRALDIKVWRDLNHMRGQVAAIALVVTCGVGVFLGLTGTMGSLQSARALYYAQTRFGEVFTSLQRAPLTVERRLAAIPGVQACQTRVTRFVTLDIPNLREAATAQLVSIPEKGQPAVNALALRLGRYPRVGHSREVLASEAFFDAHEFRLGQTLAAIVNGKRVRFEIVGVALTPEFMYAAAPGQLFPDDRRHGVLWLHRSPLAAAFDMQGAFNDVSLRLAQDASIEGVLASVDRILEPYGGQGAIARKDQPSAFFLENELTQLQSFAFVIPLLFLAVAAFLLHIVFGRLISTQRGDIAALKSFGYRDREIGLHYAKLVGVIVLLGWVGGILLGGYIGSSMTRLYGQYYRFPDLPFRIGFGALLFSGGVTMVAAAWGAWSSIRKTVLLPPAEAVRPPAPPLFKPTFVERSGLGRWLPVPFRMVLREIERKPLRMVLSWVGVALATALTIVMAFTADSIGHMIQVQFSVAQRENVQISLNQPRSLEALAVIQHLPGVMHSEPYRTVPVEMSNGRRVKRVAITGLPEQGQLLELLDQDLRSIPVAPGGLVLSRKLADQLQVGLGDLLQVKVLDGARQTRSIPIARVADTFIGMSAYMRLDELCSTLQETPSLNGARLLVDRERIDELYAAVKQTPLIAGISSRDQTLRLVREMLDENMGTMVLVSLSFAIVMAFAVLYNTIRITLAERARELATMRVLGFRRKEVAAILMGEMGIVLLLAIPSGLLLGHWMASWLVRSPGYDTEQFRLPFVIYPSTYAIATLGVLASGFVSGLGAWRRLDRFDIVEVLKTRD